MLRAIKLLSHELPEPAQNRFRSSCCSNLLETLSAKSFADLRQRERLFVGQPQPIWQMCSEDSNLGGKILELQQQLFIDEPAGVRQKLSPVVTIHHVASLKSPALHYLVNILTLRG